MADGRYKHSAPLEREGGWLTVATNIPLSAGAGRRMADGRYKHSAPLEREGGWLTVATNIPLRWSGKTGADGS
jgi:hypothetical protein